MPHDAPSALEILTADYVQTLADEDAYTPVLTAATTNPNIGSTGTISGYWARNGHKIDFWVAIAMSGTGFSAGSGLYSITLPFPADLSAMVANAASGGRGGQLGAGTYRAGDTPATNSRIVTVQLATASTVYLIQPSMVAITSTTTGLTSGTELIFQGSYIADPAGL